jgi:glycine/D-amino acid oxidase-like deaminating enzyme
MRAAGLMNPVTGRRMALTWNQAEVWENSLDFYRNAYFFLKGKPGSFLQPRLIRKVLHSPEEMNFLDAKSAWAGFGELVQTMPSENLESLHQQQFGWADIREGYRLDVPAFLKAAHAYFRDSKQMEDATFRQDSLEIKGGKVMYGGACYRKVVSCLGLGCPWIAPELWAVKGQLFVLKGLPMKGMDVIKTEHFLIPITENEVLAGSTYEREFSHEQPDEAGFETVTAGIRLDILSQIEVTRSWAGIRPTSKDRRPVVREIEQGIYCINGLGTKGVSLAPFAVNMLLNLVDKTN